MNYEQLLDEIMVTTLWAKEFIGFPQKDFRYAVCPWTLEFHTMIFLASIFLAFNQQNPFIFIIQLEELPEPIMLYSWKIWPHFWRKWDLWHKIPKWFLDYHFAQTEEKYYPYLDKLFAYLAVINTSQDHIVLYVRKGEKLSVLWSILKKLLQKQYSLLIMSDCYSHFWLQEGKKKSELLISHLLKNKMNLEEKKQFPALSLLSDFLPKEEPLEYQHFTNTGEIWLDPESTTSFWFMMK